jgi:hypothetical protein
MGALLQEHATDPIGVSTRTTSVRELVLTTTTGVGRFTRDYRRWPMKLTSGKGLSLRTKFVAVAAALAAAGVAAGVRTVVASDHQDTAEVELNPQKDMNDVFVFPGSAPDRIVLAMTVASPMTPAQARTRGFGTDVLYQFRVDNTGDAREDVVLQLTFEGSGMDQTVTVRGPAAPIFKGPVSKLVTRGPVVRGATNSMLGSSSGMQVFAGVRDDPFFIDLEQFFRIVPDRKPETGPLSQIPETPTASAFRGPNPPFAGGTPVDFLRGINGLAIVIELPTALLTRGGGSRIGVWGTTSQASRS